MARAMVLLRDTIHQARGGSLGKLLYDVGWAIMGVDGGATGPLFGAFFMGMSQECPEKGPLNLQCVAKACNAGLERVRGQTQAQIGDKTLLDALIPAVSALNLAAERGVKLMEAFQQAAEAASRGAVATAGLQARFGRAKYVGSQSVGFQDPGAASVAYLFKGFVEGLDDSVDGA